MSITVNFTQLLIKFQPELLRFAYKLTANSDEAKDLLQATSLKALDNKYMYNHDTNFRGWIYTIMRNLFVNNYRKVLREQIYIDDVENLYLMKNLTERSDGVYESSYDIKEMYRIVNSLPDDLKIPFAMYVSGFKYREISDKLNLPIGTVKSKIYITRNKLKIIFKDFI